jgi:NADH:ubiquinone oxidoreductase subunit D
LTVSINDATNGVDVSAIIGSLDIVFGEIDR